VFSLYLYQPYVESFELFDYLLIVNCICGAVGCFILSRRWVVSFAGSFFAGATYGFGPFVLFLGRFHPTAGSIAAIVPWLFLPAVFALHRKSKWIKLLLALLPFAAIIGIFLVVDLLHRYPIPTQLKLKPLELYSLLAPAALVNKVDVLIGFYHVPVAPLIIGAAMLFKAKRYSTMIVFVAGLALSFCPVILGTSIIIWLTVPLVCCSVLIGEGTDGLVHAGYNDRKWVLASAVVFMIAAVITLIMGTKSTYVIAGLGSGYTRLFIAAVRMYILGAIAMVVIFFFAKGRSRLLWLRTLILSSAMAVDIFLGARHIIDSIH